MAWGLDCNFVVFYFSLRREVRLYHKKKSIVAWGGILAGTIQHGNPIFRTNTTPAAKEAEPQRMDSQPEPQMQFHRRKIFKVITTYITPATAEK